MKRIYKILICISLLFITGCNKNNEKFILNEKYYNNGDFIRVNSNELEKLENDNYILYTYNNYCAFSVSCEDIFKSFMNKYKIDFISIPFEEFKKTKLYNKIKYAPSVIIVKNGKVVSYLDSNSNDDYQKYQNEIEFEKWISKYVVIDK